jgi:MFS family permease
MEQFDGQHGDDRGAVLDADFGQSLKAPELERSRRTADDFGGLAQLGCGFLLALGAGSLLCALSGSLEPLLVGRALQGTGAGLLLPNSLALLNGAYEGEARGRAIGTWAAAGAIAAAIAPPLGGWLVDHVGWQSIFYINLPFVATAILVALARVAEVKEPEKARLDLGGAALATLGLGAATYGLTLWSQKFVLTPTAATALIIGAVLLTLFIFYERRLGTRAMITCFAAVATVIRPDEH